jgi:hypothetical protein
LVRSQCTHRMVGSSWELINFADRQSAKLERGRNELVRLKPIARLAEERTKGQA